MAAGVKMSGVRELLQTVTDVGGKMDKETIGILRRGAVRVRRRQKDAAPKDKGNLNRAITYKIRGSRWRRVAEIGPKMAEQYPLYQEYGTARMAANPYVSSSVQGEEQIIATELDGMLGKVLR